ncbi:ATP-binding protein [Streptomyces spiramyceticus]|uniref:ATP-binding protein n=1 Tax=Streptomyces spiramyceticus TaxID=299717 RepID=UPI00237A3FA4|nr:ATP-binding protein [Streptomyces spiramyceticus]
MTTTAVRPAPPTLTPRPCGHPGYTTVLERREESASVARMATQTTMECWAIPDEATAAAVVIVSELMANAVRHGSGPMVRLIFERPADDRVYVALVDRAAYRLPEMRAPEDEDEEHGRGLVLVESLAHSWGFDRLGDRQKFWGKRVWAVLEATP